MLKPRRAGSIQHALSVRLHDVAMVMHDSTLLRNLHNGNAQRAKQLSTSIPELKILVDYLSRTKKDPQRPVLVAVEYDFDDGAVTDGRGDAIFFDGHRLLVVEVKDLFACGSAFDRWVGVQKQAEKYARRVCAWMQYLAFVDAGVMEKLAQSPVVPMMLTNARPKLVELPGIQPGTALLGQRYRVEMGNCPSSAALPLSYNPDHDDDVDDACV